MIYENAFYILKASTIDNRQRLSELVEDESLFNDPEKCSSACAELTNPKKRLKNEISWLLGVNNDEIISLIEKLKDHQLTISNISNLPTLANLNLCIEILTNSNFISKEYLIDWIKSFSLNFEKLSLQDIQDQINNDRSLAGFPTITDISDLENCIKEQQRYYKEQINAILSKFSLEEKVEILTEVAEELSDVGEKECPIMVIELVDSYETESQPLLNSFLEKIKELSNTILEYMSSDGKVRTDTYIDSLCEEVKKWDKYAQPIQVVTKSQGLKHSNSEEIGSLIRSLSITLFNDYGLIEASKKLTELLQTAFAEVARVEELAEQDAQQLENIENQIHERVENEKRAEEKYKKTVFYDGECGLIFKDHIKITGEYVVINDKKLSIDNISGISWHASTINFSTTYYINLYTSTGETTFKPNKKVYLESIKALWQTVVIKIIFDISRKCSQGKEVTIDSVTLTNDGVYFKKSGLLHLFSSERIFCPWNQVKTSAGNGLLFVIKDKSAYTSISNGLENSNVFEAIVNIMHDKRLSKLSDLLK